MGTSRVRWVANSKGNLNLYCNSEIGAWGEYKIIFFRLLVEEDRYRRAMKDVLPLSGVMYFRVLWTYWLVDFNTRFINFYYIVLRVFFPFSFSTTLQKLPVSVIRHMHIFQDTCSCTSTCHCLIFIFYKFFFFLGCLAVQHSVYLPNAFWLLPCCFFLFFPLFHLSFRIVNFWYVFSIPKVVPPVWCRNWMCSWASFGSCLFPWERNSRQPMSLKL